METFVTGGKTWVLPEPEHDVPFVSAAPTPMPHALTVSPVSAPPVTPLSEKIWDFTKSFFFGTGIMFFYYGIAFLIPLTGIIIASILSDPSPNIQANGGIVFNKPDSFSFTPHFVALLLLPPTIASVIMTCIDEKTHFLDNATGKRTGFCLAIIGAVFIVCSWLVCNDLGLTVSDTDTFNNIQQWMSDRYGFEPYRVSELSELVDGEVLYSQDPQFPAHDVYFKELNGAYFLFDGNGTELPVKN